MNSVNSYTRIVARQLRSLHASSGWEDKISKRDFDRAVESIDVKEFAKKEYRKWVIENLQNDANEWCEDTAKPDWIHVMDCLASDKALNRVDKCNVLDWDYIKGEIVDYYFKID